MADSGYALYQASEVQTGEGLLESILQNTSNLVITQNLDMNGFKAINAGNATSPQDYVTLAQLGSISGDKIQSADTLTKVQTTNSLTQFTNNSIPTLQIDNTQIKCQETLNINNNRVINMANAVSALDGLNRQTADARYYLQTTPLQSITQPTADVSLNSFKLTNLANPVATTDALNLQTGNANYMAKTDSLATISQANLSVAPINANNQKITNLAAATIGSDAVRFDQLPTIGSSDHIQSVSNNSRIDASSDTALTFKTNNLGIMNITESNNDAILTTPIGGMKVLPSNNNFEIQGNASSNLVGVSITQPSGSEKIVVLQSGTPESSLSFGSVTNYTTLAPNLPAQSNAVFIQNLGSAGGDAMIMSSGQALVQNSVAIYSDSVVGLNPIQTQFNRKAGNVAGITITEPNQFATKNYVDTHSGGSGNQIVNAINANSKLTADQTKLTNGSTPLDMSNQTIDNLPNPTTALQAVNKQYLDNTLSNMSIPLTYEFVQLACLSTLVNANCSFTLNQSVPPAVGSTGISLGTPNFVILTNGLYRVLANFQSNNGGQIGAQQWRMVDQNGNAFPNNAPSYYGGNIAGQYGDAAFYCSAGLMAIVDARTTQQQFSFRQGVSGGLYGTCIIEKISSTTSTTDYYEQHVYQFNNLGGSGYSNFTQVVDNPPISGTPKIGLNGTNNGITFQAGIHRMQVTGYPTANNSATPISIRNFASGDYYPSNTAFWGYNYLQIQQLSGTQQSANTLSILIKTSVPITIAVQQDQGNVFGCVCVESITQNISVSVNSNTTQSLNQISTANPTSNSVSMNSNKLTLLANATVSTDAVNLGQLNAKTINNLANQTADYNTQGFKLTGLATATAPSDAVRFDQLTAGSGNQIANTIVPTSRLIANQTELTAGSTVLNMNGNRITNVQNGVANSDVATVGQIQASTSQITSTANPLTWVNCTGTTTTLQQNGNLALLINPTQIDCYNPIQLHAQQIKDLASGTLSTDAINLGQLTSELSGKYSTTVPLNSITLASSDLNLNNHRINNILDGINPQDAVSKFQLDQAVSSSGGQIINTNSSMKATCIDGLQPNSLLVKRNAQNINYVLNASCSIATSTQILESTANFTFRNASDNSLLWDNATSLFNVYKDFKINSLNKFHCSDTNDDLSNNGYSYLVPSLALGNNGSSAQNRQLTVQKIGQNSGNGITDGLSCWFDGIIANVSNSSQKNYIEGGLNLLTSHGQSTNSRTIFNQNLGQWALYTNRLLANTDGTSIYCDGDLRVNGIIIQTNPSDRRLKKSIQKLEANQQILNIQPVSFMYDMEACEKYGVDLEAKRNQIQQGLIAQDIPQQFVEMSKQGVYAVDYSKLHKEIIYQLLIDNKAKSKQIKELQKIQNLHSQQISFLLQQMQEITQK